MPVCIIRPLTLTARDKIADSLSLPLIAQALNPSCHQFAVNDPRPRRDYLHVQDLVSLLLATLDKPSGVYNAGSGRSVSIMELVATINTLTHSKNRSSPSATSGGRRFSTSSQTSPKRKGSYTDS